MWNTDLTRKGFTDYFSCIPHIYTKMAWLLMFRRFGSFFASPTIRVDADVLNFVCGSICVSCKSSSNVLKSNLDKSLVCLNASFAAR